MLHLRSIIVTACFCVCSPIAGWAESGIVVTPAAVVFDSPESSQQVLVTRILESAKTDGSRTVGAASTDVTRAAQFTLTPPGVAVVDDGGFLRPVADGRATLYVTHEGTQRSIPIEVKDLQTPQPVSFRNDVVPLLTKAGCNSGGCHGKAEGQAGFKLSIFGFDPESDFDALTRESRGRRIVVAAPVRSMLYLKGSARVPHGGGRRIEPGGYRDRRLLRWIAEGARFNARGESEAKTVGVEIEPTQQILTAGRTQQIRVTAIDAKGRRRGVTAEAEYESNATAVAEVDSRGLIQTADVPGEAAILVRYLGHVAVCRVTLPQPGVSFPRPPEVNFIDRLVWDKLERLGVAPSDLATDAEFLRRVYLDVVGTLPTADEARAFLADSSTDKRAKLIDRLLDRPEYADYNTMRWLDVLRADQLKISPQGAVAMQRWLHRKFAENRPFDEFARDLLTVEGNTAAEGPGSFYKILTKPDEASRAVSQLLLGVRIECAQCHQHPSERWTQADYVGLAGFFTGVKLKKLPNGEQAVVSRGGTDLPHPRTQEAVPARALGAESADFTHTADRRRVLADWVASPENPYFAKAIANRLWAHYFGRGLVEPVDDLRATNPAANEPLMQALAEHMVAVKFDLKAFTRTLLNSRVYQLTSQTVESNERDVQNFSHARYKALPAEVLLDAVSETTGVAEKFNGWPDGYRAIQVWDNRMPSYFFRIFGRPVRASVCECERSNEPSIAQALHLLNAPEIAEKISHRTGRPRRLAESELPPEQIIEEIYLAALSRFPTEAERELMMQAFTDPQSTRRTGAEDVLWTVLNSKEFVYNH